MASARFVVGLVGLAGAGKSTAASIIETEFAFTTIRPGDFLREMLEDQDMAETPENERRVQTAVRAKHGMDALARFCLPQIRDELAHGRNVLLDSMCSYSEREYLRAELSSITVIVIAFHATVESRRERLVIRGRRPMTPAQLLERDTLEIEHLEKAKLMVLADHHIVNLGGFNELEMDARKLIGRLLALG